MCMKSDIPEGSDNNFPNNISASTESENKEKASENVTNENNDATREGRNIINNHILISLLLVQHHLAAISQYVCKLHLFCNSCNYISTILRLQLINSLFLKAGLVGFRLIHSLKYYAVYCNQAFHSIHVTEQFSGTFCEIICAKIGDILLLSLHGWNVSGDNSIVW